MNQNVIFIFEIKVDGAVCNSGFSGDLRYGCLGKTLLGKYLNRCFQNPMIFVVCFYFSRTA